MTSLHCIGSMMKPCLETLTQCCPTRGPHAARRLISCGPPVLAKKNLEFRNNIMCKKQVKDKTLLDILQYQHKSNSLNLLNIWLSTHK